MVQSRTLGSGHYLRQGGGLEDFHIFSRHFFTFPLMASEKISGSPHQSGKKIDVPPPPTKVFLWGVTML